MSTAFINFKYPNTVAVIDRLACKYLIDLRYIHQWIGVDFYQYYIQRCIKYVKKITSDKIIVGRFQEKQFRENQY